MTAISGESTAVSSPAPLEHAPDGRRRRWNEHREQRRRVLVTAGITAIDRYGPDASADQVAALAGVSRSVLYRYFRDKDDLALAISQQLVEVVLASLSPPLQAGGSAKEIIHNTVSVVVDWLDQHPNLYEFLRLRGRVAGLDVVEVTTADQIAGVLTRFMVMFGLDAGSATPGAYGIVGLVESTSTWWLKHRPTPRSEFVDHLCATVWYVIDGSLRSRGFVLDPDLVLPPEPAARDGEPT